MSNHGVDLSGRLPPGDRFVHRTKCVEKYGSVIGCVPKTIITMGSDCIRRTAPDSGAYIVPSGSWGTWLSQPDGGLGPCKGEHTLPDGTLKPVSDP